MLLLHDHDRSQVLRPECSLSAPAEHPAASTASRISSSSTAPPPAQQAAQTNPSAPAATMVPAPPRPAPRLRKFKAAGLDGLDLFAVSPADATAEAFANQDNQVYFDKGAITLREGAGRQETPNCRRCSRLLLLGRAVSSAAGRPAVQQCSPCCCVSALLPCHAAGDVVLDCGANVGSFARMAAPVLGERGTIFCIEPIPDVCAALDVNIDKYQQWADARKLKVARMVSVHAGAAAAERTHARACRQLPPPAGMRASSRCARPQQPSARQRAQARRPR